MIKVLYKSAPMHPTVKMQEMQVSSMLKEYGL